MKNSLIRTKMKRKTVGQLRPISKKKRLTTYIDSSDDDSDVEFMDVVVNQLSISEKVFNVPYFLEEQLLPYFEDEYDFFVFKQVNKASAVATNNYLMRNLDSRITDPRLSLLSNWFYRHQICCVCKIKCTSNYGYSMGLYCHDKCIPDVKLYYTDEWILTSSATERLGRPCVYLCDSHSPCIGNVANTCRGYNLKNSWHTYKVLDNDLVKYQLESIEKYILFVRKGEQLRRTIDMDDTVRVGVTPVKVYNYFCDINPNHFNNMSLEEIVRSMKKVKEGLQKAHEITRDVFRYSIRPKLFVTKHDYVKNWTHVLRAKVPELKNYRYTMVTFFSNHKIHENHHYISNFIKGLIPELNELCLKDALFRSTIHYNDAMRQVIPTLTRRGLNFSKNEIHSVVERVISNHSEVFTMYPVNRVYVELFNLCRFTVDKINTDLVKMYHKTKNREISNLASKSNRIIREYC